MICLFEENDYLQEHNTNVNMFIDSVKRQKQYGDILLQGWGQQSMKTHFSSKGVIAYDFTTALLRQCYISLNKRD